MTANSDEAEDRFMLSRWRWRFVDDIAERSYQDWRIERAVPYLRIACVAAMGTWMLGLVFLQVSAPHLVPRVGAMFGFVACPLIALTFAVTYLPKQSKLMIPLGAITNGGAGLAAVWVAETTFDVIGSASALMVFVAFFSFVLIRLPLIPALLSVVPGISYVVLMLSQQFHGSRINQIEFAVFTFLPIATFITGCFVSYLLELMMRSAFRGECIIEQQHQALMEERAQLSRFLAPEVTRLVREKGIEFALLRQTLTLTAVCCDLRGFTRFTDQHGADKMALVLSAYYGTVVEVARRYEATIKDFVGDGVLILVGAPIERNDHIQAGMSLARALSAAIGDLTRQHSTVATPLGVGIGVASGPCTVGAIGSQSRLEYTAVGSAVNLSARLCASAEDGEILISPEIAKHVELSAKSTTRPLNVKGFAQPVNVTVEVASEEPAQVNGVNPSEAQQVAAGDAQPATRFGRP
jgi:class 3 adenylate cyclase